MRGTCKGRRQNEKFVKNFLKMLGVGVGVVDWMYMGQDREK